MNTVSAFYGKNKTKTGIPPAVVLINPKYPRNVGAVIRAASCFGLKQVWYTGNRVSLVPDKKYRLPREERMKGYGDVELKQFDYPFDEFENAVPVAIEVRENSENLITFEHPENAVYVFGPEDGGIERVHMQHCHRIVTIPTRHCTNLAAAVYITLYDRYMKRVNGGLEEIYNVGECEQRGYEEDKELG
jgi:tRNA(Leu) C34 or U34 (ribose-2'-O)-methylase TrmL